MKQINHHYIEDLIQRYPLLEESRNEIRLAVEHLIDVIKKDGKLLICGNGGSSADAEHIVGELMKGFNIRRPLPPGIKDHLISIDKERGAYLGDMLQMGIPAISLGSSISLNSAFSNDVDPMLIYAQQILGLGKAGDALLALTTSGKSENVIHSAVTARSLDMKVISLTGREGTPIEDFSDVCIKVAADETYKVQEYHIPIYHTICLIMEDYFFHEDH